MPMVGMEPVAAPWVVPEHDVRSKAAHPMGHLPALGEPGLELAVVPAEEQYVAGRTHGACRQALLFLAGLWVNPAQVGDPLQTIMYYSPSGAASRALLDSVFNGGPSYAALLTMAVYTVIFGFIAIRYFRWE